MVKEDLIGGKNGKKKYSNLLRCHQQEEMKMDTKKLIPAAHENAVEKGFYECRECKREKIFPQCDHPGCYHHESHPCEGCGRIGGKCPTCQGTGKHRDVGGLLMLIVTEIEEAVEAHRNGRFVTGVYTLKNLFTDKLSIQESISVFEDKFKDTFEDEIADTFIRLFDLCGYIKADLYYTNILEECEKSKTIPGQLYAIFRQLPSQSQSDEHVKRVLPHFYSVLIDFCKHHEINIEAHIHAKMAYNKTRPKKHGKRY